MCIFPFLLSLFFPGLEYGIKFVSSCFLHLFLRKAWGQDGDKMDTVSPTPSGFFLFRSSEPIRHV